jgi:hypothetical protein
MGLSEQELQEVARYMRHELAVHRKFGRLQDDVIELAKVSKLLLAVEDRVAHTFASKSLDDVDLDGKLINITLNLQVISSEE